MNTLPPPSEPRSPGAPTAPTPRLAALAGLALVGVIGLSLFSGPSGALLATWFSGPFGLLLRLSLIAVLRLTQVLCALLWLAAITLQSTTKRLPRPRTVAALGLAALVLEDLLTPS